MLVKGTTAAPYLGTAESGRTVIDNILQRRNLSHGKQIPPGMEIIIELSRDIKLEDTSVGEVVTEELRGREEKRRQQEEEEQRELETQREKLRMQGGCVFDCRFMSFLDITASRTGSLAWWPLASPLSVLSV